MDESSADTVGKEIPQLMKGCFQAVADEYVGNWVMLYNRSVNTKKAFINQFKEKWKLLPVRTFSVRHADGHVKSRKGKVKPATINRELACLRYLLG